MGRTRCLLHICGNTKEEDEQDSSDSGHFSAKTTLKGYRFTSPEASRLGK